MGAARTARDMNLAAPASVGTTDEVHNVCAGL